MPGKRREGYSELEKELLLSISDAFVQIRAASGLTQRQAARLIESTPSRISELENAKTDIMILTLQKWADAYGYRLELSFIPYEEVEDDNRDTGCAANS